MIRRIKTIDAHAGGEPLRLIVSGFPAPAGETMLDKSAWVRKRRDRIRRALMHEPRGHTDMYGAVLTEPVRAGSDAGVLFMHNAGYSTMCGHGVIAVVTIAIERSLAQLAARGESRASHRGRRGARPARREEGEYREYSTPLKQSPAPARAGCLDGRMQRDFHHGLLDPRRDIVLDTPAGPVRATATLSADSTSESPRVERVSFVNVPSFVLSAGLTVRAGGRDLPIDVAFGGAFYAIVDSEAAGIPLRGDSLPALRSLAAEIKRAVEKAVDIVHPIEAGLHGIYGTIFTGPPIDPSADLRNVAIFADGQVDRSPCGTGTAAVMAVVDAMGLLTADGVFVHESLIGTVFTGAVESRTTVGGHQAIVARIEGSAWITGEHEFIIDTADPLANGFRL